MVLWQSDLRISWRAQWFSLLMHGVVAALVLLMPWPLSYTPLWLILLSLVVFDCVRSQRRIHARQGEIKLLIDSRLRWQKAEWDIIGTPWVINSGMLLRLRNTENQRTQHLWVAADSMEPFHRGFARTSSECAHRSGRTGSFHQAPGQRTAAHRQ
ncbi:MAG: protein YgfX [Klebsiella michiganensis]|nr:protein YgfX [Klebsiella michiganensis]